jgi:hypothetical protein
MWSQAKSPGQGFCPTSWNQVSTGRFIIDPRLLLNDSTAFKCAICKQSLLISNKGVCRISFRKSQQANLSGFTISTKVKGSGKNQPLCLACVERWVGKVSFTKTTVGVLPAGWVGPPEVWFNRTQSNDSWRQRGVLLGEEVIWLQMMDAKSREAAGGKRSKSAAEAALNRGRQEARSHGSSPRR